MSHRLVGRQRKQGLTIQPMGLRSQEPVEALEHEFAKGGGEALSGSLG